MVPGLRCASSPHHITAVFAPHYSDDPSRTGSIGVGLAVEPRARACPGSGGAGLPTARRALSIAGLEGGLDYRLPLPPGAGYAVSAAASIVAVLSLGSGRGVTVMEAFRAAHRAEVLEGTGLGDVLAIYCGVGVVVRTAPGEPGVGRSDCFQVPRGVDVVSIEVGSMHTRELLRLYGSRIPAAEAERTVMRIWESRSFEYFAEEVSRFSVRFKTIQESLGWGWRDITSSRGVIGYYAKKGVVVFLVESEHSEGFTGLLEGLGYKPRRLSPSTHGVEVY